jgi:hypothetical protein
MAALAVELVIGLGGMLLTSLFQPKPKPQYGSRLSNINVPPVSVGNTIPRVWGTFKVPGQMIFASPLIETMHTHHAAKKGGGKGMGGGGNSATTYTYTYSVDIAVAVCAGPVYRINRVWANQKLLYIDPTVAAREQIDFDAAYQSEATRLIDEEGLDVAQAAASAYIFAYNNFYTFEVTNLTVDLAAVYVTTHPIDDTQGITGQMLLPGPEVLTILNQLFSGINTNNTFEAQINRFDVIEIFLGSDRQGPSGLLEGYLGIGNVPAFRNCCYFVLTNLQLMDFGNTVPSMTVEVQTSPSGTTSLVEVITSMCFQSGLADDQFDATSNVDDTPFQGFAVLANTSVRETVSELQKVFPIDAAETGYGIVFSMVNKRASQIFNRPDLGTHQDSEALPPSMETTITSDYDLPYRINLKYQEAARSYSPNMLYAMRSNTPSKTVEDNDVTVALDRAVAQNAVSNLLAHRMFGRRSYKMSFPRQYVTVEPTDVFKMPNKVNAAFMDQYYVTEVHVGANGIVSLTAVDHIYVDPNLNPLDQVSQDFDVAVGGNTSLPTTSQTVPFLLDTPLLTDVDTDGPGFYVVLSGAFNGWSGGSLFVDAAAPTVSTAYGLDILTPTAGSAWTTIASNGINVPQGTALGTLAPNMVSCYWDRTSVLLVRIANGMDLVAAAEDDILVQPLNVTMIGNEVVQYANVVDRGNGLWQVSTFLRGLKGTERWINSHVAGERFVRLTSAMKRVRTTIADVNQSDNFQAISNSQPASTAVSFSFSDTGNSMRPLTVAVERKFRNVTGAIEVDWVPRVRQNGSWLSLSDVKLAANDLPEQYQVDVCTTADPTTAVATYTITPTPGALAGTFVYTTAQQVTDLGAAANPVHLAIYQMSAVIGRGFGLGVKV